MARPLLAPLYQDFLFKTKFNPLTADKLSPCQEAYKKATQNPKVGSYIPRCKDDGSFENIQCEGESGHCWCVDKDGSEIPGTRTTGNLQCPDPGIVNESLMDGGGNVRQVCFKLQISMKMLFTD